MSPLDKTVRLGIATARPTKAEAPPLTGLALLDAPCYGAEQSAGSPLMSNSSRTAGRKRLGATLVAAALFVAAIPGPDSAYAAGVCALVPNERAPTEKILQCGETLTVHPAPGARYRPLYKKGDPLPVGIRPLAIAAVRGTKWAVDVAKARTSVLVLDGAVGVTNRRLNQYVIVTEGEGVDITPTDTSTVQKTWGYARVRALLSRFGE
jgi:hypothetical protein